MDSENLYAKAPLLKSAIMFGFTCLSAATAQSQELQKGLPGDAAAWALLILAGIVFGVILAILWTVLPFAIFGTKPLLRQLIAETRETNRLLAQVFNQPNSAKGQ